MLASLLLADELHDTRKAIAVVNPAQHVDPEKPARLRRLAARAEEIAADLTDA